MITPDSFISLIEVVALAGALAHAGEHGHAAVLLGDVVDELHDEHRLADAGAAEQADLAALGVGGDQVDDLDAGLEDLRGGLLLVIGGADRGGCSNALAGDGLGLVIDGSAEQIEDAAERLVADGDA